MLTVYKHEVYNPRYFERGSRSSGNNASWVPGESRDCRELRLGVSDRSSIVALVSDYMRQTNDPAPDPTGRPSIENSLGGWNPFTWFETSRRARPVLLHLENRLCDAVHCYAADKPP